MENPPSSKRSSSARRLATVELDLSALEAFAAAEGVSVESLIEAIEEPSDLSIIEAHIRAPKDEPVLLAGRFELIKQVGAGSFGRVFMARDRVLSRRVAVKIMPLEDGELAGVAEREARTLAALDHPNVVTIYDQGNGDDYRYLVLEWLEGESLFSWCIGKSQEEIIARYIEVGEGLAAAHRRGVVHRDFKSNNVMLDADGQAVLVDFGLARSIESLQGHEPAYLCGALTHLAPERFLGAPGDTRSDQFAFCVSLWEALTGVDPFLRDSPSPPGAEGGELAYVEGRIEALRCGPEAGRELVPRRVREALERGLAWIPEERWPSMDALLEALRSLEARQRSMWMALATGVLAVILLAVGLSTIRAPEPTMSLTSLPMLDYSGTGPAIEGLALIAGHQPRDGFEIWSEYVEPQGSRHPLWTAWWSLAYADQFEREGSPTGQLLAAWTTEGAAQAYELGEAWEAAANARQVAAQRAELAGDLRMAASLRECAAVNLSGMKCR